MRQTEINMGYYIVEDVIKPSFISFSCDRLISSSNCICNMHPDLRGCFWMGYRDEKKAYKQKLGLSDEEYIKMSECVSELFRKGMLEVNDRFNSLDTALEFCRTYLNKCENIHIIGLFTTDKYIKVLLEQFENPQYFKQIVPDTGRTDIKKRFMGCEIIGYDMGLDNPHSYLCNSLDKELIGHGLLTDKWGLIQNDFEQAQEFAELIQGKGEPVDWIPVKLYEYYNAV